ncbi:hypothetical protein KKF59_03670 [Patescibacteria group bacterium]|nr:hypothetical protein [Patescibacteria group bacterium]
MEKRNKLIILIFFAAIILATGLYILLKPFFPSTTEQPPELPEQVLPVQTPVTLPPTREENNVTALPQDLKELQDLASAFVARIGSGSSGSGFQGYDDVLINATPKFQAQLLDEQAAMQKAHPAAGPMFGITTRVISNKASSVVSGAASVTFVVSVQQAEDAGNPGAPTAVKYKEATIVFQKQSDGTYLINDVTWKDLEL